MNLKFKSAMAPLVPFFAGLAVTLAAAVVAPGLGASGGPIHTENLTGPAVMLIFLIQGLQLPAREVCRGFAAWPVHIFCQAWMFLVFPLLGYAVVAFFGGALGPGQRVGILYLSMLPTTVATNAAFSSRAGGNTAAALFNIVVGNLLGVFIAPAWLAYLLAKGAGASVDPVPLIKTICLQLILPFAVGQLFRLRFYPLIDRIRPALREIGSWLIFFIVYSAVCNLLAGKTGRVEPVGLIPVVAATLTLLVFGKVACWAVLRLLGWSHDLRVAAFYSASQKTLAAGLPIAGAVFAAAGGGPELPPLAILALPLVVFHIGQLIVGALLIPVIGRDAAAR